MLLSKQQSVTSVMSPSHTVSPFCNILRPPLEWDHEECLCRSRLYWLLTSISSIDLDHTWRILISAHQSNQPSVQFLGTSASSHTPSNDDYKFPGTSNLYSSLAQNLTPFRLMSSLSNFSCVRPNWEMTASLNVGWIPCPIRLLSSWYKRGALNTLTSQLRPRFTTSGIPRKRLWLKVSKFSSLFF